MDKNQEKELIVKIKNKGHIGVDEAIKTIREEGGINALEALIEVYPALSADKKDQISLLFNDLREKDCIPLMVKHIKSNKDAEIRKMLLTACWQCRLNFIQQLEAFILVVLSEPFEFAFEAFTVVENLDARVSVGRKQELISFTKEHITKCKEDNIALAHGIVGIIENYEEA